jgi:cellulose biosynthesis protein BcsQ
MVSFLPAKPGSGASTLAWHFANLGAAILGADVALLDLDLNCGAQGMFGGVQTGVNPFDVISVVDHSGKLPDSPHIPRYGRVQIFGAMRRCLAVRIDSRLFANFLQSARRNYALVVADHLGNWERYSVEAMQASGMVYCVSGTDYLALTQANLARTLMEDATILPVVRLVLNRHSARFGASPEQAERLAGLKLAGCLPNCYGEMQRATGNHYLVPQHSSYAQAAGELVVEMLRGAGKFREAEAWESSRETNGASSLLAALGPHRKPKAQPAPQALLRG